VAAVGWAHRLARPVFAAPGSIYSATSHGTHELIRHQHATLVTHPEQVTEAINRSEPVSPTR